MMKRRDFVRGSVLASSILPMAESSLSFASTITANPQPRRIVVGVMGLSRGKDLARDLLQIPGVEIKYACDVDSKRVAAGVKFINESGAKAEAVQDFRRMLDDKEVDAIFCAAPNHWHGPATILGCKAGKHVYVEKPACHNPQEGEWMVQIANSSTRCVQVGNQRRSSPGYQEAIRKIHAGEIGKVYLARSFFQRMRGPIGTKQDSQPPASLDYDLWQGPVPKRPYRENVVHYNWHWFWHWGNGELGNNGVHGLDICRWGLQVDFPIRTTSSGGRYCYQDDQETPDTHTVAWQFDGGKEITYQGVSCSQHEPGPFVSFYGSEGFLELDGDGGYKIYDPKNKLISSSKATGSGQADHIKNFIEAIRADAPTMLNQPILSGHQSALLCHLGNTAHRTNRVISTQSTDGRWLDETIPKTHWRREYDPKWEKEIAL
jgi:predicted dehydrogenase